jgi:hypothetical protein
MTEANLNKIPAAIEVHAHCAPDSDGAWVTCPHCDQDNATTWSGLKICTQCDHKFFVAAGPLVRERYDHPKS